jgi:clathrin heavy chain
VEIFLLLDQLEKIFDRAPQLAAHLIIDYQVSYDRKYLALVGIIGGTDGKTLGHVQLYSVAQKGSHPVDAHACCFMRIKKTGGLPDAVLFCFAARTDGGAGQVINRSSFLFHFISITSFF